MSNEIVRFVHTSDLQLGMTRQFLDDDAQARYSEARIDALTSIGRLATEHQAEFVVVAGDVFETNRVRPRTVGRALEAMATIKVPVYLLPGNHDPIDAGSVFVSPTFVRSKPPNVVVLDTAMPREVRPGVEVVGAPWATKRPLRDLVGDAADSLSVDPLCVRVMVGHGQVDSFLEHENPAAIRLATAERALEQGRIQYIALGDRHSTTDVGGSGRIWYSGSPEPTAHDEVDAGNVLFVEASRDKCRISRESVGTWQYVSGSFDFDELESLEGLEEWLASLPSKDRSVVRLSLRGVISLLRYTELETLLDRSRAIFGSIEEWEPTSQLIIRPEDDDFSDLGLSGFAKRSVERLRLVAAADGPDAKVARDALALLVRLARGQSLDPA